MIDKNNGYLAATPLKPKELNDYTLKHLYQSSKNEFMSIDEDNDAKKDDDIDHVLTSTKKQISSSLL